MIKIFEKEQIEQRFAAILTFGFNKGYTFNSIEEIIKSSPFIYDLEKGVLNLNKSLEEVIKDTYIEDIKFTDISFEALFIAESYIRLFFDINKSFEYIFLYWPLDYFMNHYNVYHEMDYSSFKNDFDSEVSQTSLFKKLCKKYKYSNKDISRLTGININTLNKYSVSDNAIYNASYENIYLLSKVFNINKNVFIRNTYIYLDDSVIRDKLNDTRYKSYLGLYYVLYFDKTLSDDSYTYISNKDSFHFERNNIELKSIFIDSDDISLQSLSKAVDINTYLIVFPIGYMDIEIEEYRYLSKLDYKEVLIVIEDKVYLLKRNLSYELTNTITTMLMIRAKSI